MASRGRRGSGWPADVVRVDGLDADRVDQLERRLRCRPSRTTPARCRAGARVSASRSGGAEVGGVDVLAREPARRAGTIVVEAFGRTAMNAVPRGDISHL